MIAQHPLAPVADGPDADGFTGWTFPGDGYNAVLGRMATRGEGRDTIRVRAVTGTARANVGGTLHGGFLLAVVDQAIFVGPTAIGRLTFGTAVTLSVSTQFLAPGRTDVPLDCVVEIVGETRRLLFLRGQLEQGDTVVLTFQATLSKRASSGST